MAAISDLVRLVSPETPGCPDIMIQQQILMAGIDFIKNAEHWVETMDPITLLNGIDTYDLDVPADARLIDIKSVTLPEGEIYPRTMANIAVVLPDWQSAKSSRPLYYVAGSDYATLRVFPMPENPGGLQMTVRASYQPTLSATTLPDSVVMEHTETLLSGAKYKLMRMPGRSWSNPQLALYYQGIFEAGCAQARIDAIHGGVGGSLTVKMRAFG